MLEVLAFSSSSSSLSVEEYCVAAAEELFNLRGEPQGAVQQQQAFVEALERRKLFVKTAMVQVLEVRLRSTFSSYSVLEY